MINDSLADLDAAIRLDPNDSMAWANRGEFHLRQGHLDRAKTDLDKAISLNPNNSMALANRGMAHWQQGRLDRAETDLAKAISLDPLSSLALTLRGTVHRRQGSLDLAMIDLDEAIRRNHGNHIALALRGEVHRLKGSLDLAKTDLDKAIELEPNNSMALANRSEVHRLQGHLDQAKRDSDKAFGADLGNRVHQVAKCGILSLIEYHYKQDTASITKKDQYNKTPLYYATKNHYSDVVRYLAGKYKSCADLIEVYRTIGEVAPENKCLEIINDIIDDLVCQSGIEIPERFQCPITKQLILVPYQVGQRLYEKAAWMKWKKHAAIDPITREKNPIENDILVVFIYDDLRKLYISVDKLNQSKKRQLVPPNSERPAIRRKSGRIWDKRSPDAHGTTATEETRTVSDTSSKPR